MADRDKVLAKLWEYEPYFREGSGTPLVTVSTEFLRDVAELLTPVAAKKLSLEELMDLPSGTMVWRDEINEGEEWLTPMVPQYLECVEKRKLFPSEDEGECFVFSDGSDPVDKYGEWFWFWDGRPTDEQRWAERNKDETHA